MLEKILIKEPYSIYSLRLHNKSSKLMYAEWIAVFVWRISNLIGLRLLSEHLLT